MASRGQETSSGGLCCLCKALFKLIAFVGFSVFSFWLIFRPHRFKAYITTASLSRFDLAADNSTLQYNLSLDLNIRNPNRRIGIYYDRIEATALYDGSQLNTTTLPTFYQHTKNTTVLHPAFDGRSPALGTAAATFKRDKGEGFFYVEVKGDAKIRLKVWFIKTRHFNTRIECMVKIPAPGSSKPFENTKCHVDY
ncbi:NDR1/HIN1-like protein 10 [Cocos nucifera]|nr:NDR1/HIN1-like protein 10 [Cocos nucifera]